MKRARVCTLRVAVAALVVAGVGVVAGAGTADAHPIAPSTLHLDETAPGVARARLHTPTAAQLTPRWPAGCVAIVTAAPSSVDDFTTEHFALDCHGHALAGARLGIDGLRQRDSIAIVRVRLHDGRVAREVLGPAHPRFDIPAAASWTHGLTAALRRGAAHLLTSLPHLLLLLGLLLVAGPGLRARGRTLAAFSLGHATSFALAACDLLPRVPAGAALFLAAASLLVLARLALRRDGEPATTSAVSATTTAALALTIGLLHGLGIATACSSGGSTLPPGHPTLGLASFDLGLQLAQLAVVTAGLTVAKVAGPVLRRLPRVAPHLRTTLAYGLGGLAAMWCLEPALILLS